MIGRAYFVNSFRVFLFSSDKNGNLITSQSERTDNATEEVILVENFTWSTDVDQLEFVYDNPNPKLQTWTYSISGDSLRLKGPEPALVMIFIKQD